MATPEFIAVYSDAATGGAEVDVADVDAGDWLVACVGQGYADDNDTLDLEPADVGSDTWSGIGDQVGSSGDPDQENFFGAAHYLTSSEARSTATVTVTGQGDNWTHLVVLHLRDCDAIEDVSDHVASQNGGEADETDWPIGPIDTATDDALLIGQWGGIQFDDALSWTVPASMSEEAQTDDAPDEFQAFVVGTEVLTSSGDTGTRTGVASIETANGFAGKLFAISGTDSVVETAIGRAGSMTGARTLSLSKATALGRAGTTGAARALTSSKALTLARVGAAAGARSPDTGKATAVGRAGSLAGARAVTSGKALALGPAGVAGGARPLGTAKATALGQAGQLDGVRAFVERGGLGRVGGSSLARPLGLTSKATALGRTGPAAGVRPLIAVHKTALGRAGGTAGARPLGVDVVEVLGPAGVTALARALSSSKATALGRAGSSAGPRQIGPRVPVWPLRADPPAVVRVASGMSAVERVASCSVPMVERVATGTAHVR